jgi:2,5-diketo-D-gluconate reductase B
MNIFFQRSYQRAFGTYPLTGDTCMSAIAVALEAGYRAFDTAQMYGNEVEVGQALGRGGVARDELCITTKVHPDNDTDAAFMPSVRRSLEDLGLDAVDALLLHWPPVRTDIRPSLDRLRAALDAGLTRHIGISNFNARMMRETAAHLDVPVVTNQVEFHPLLNQDILLGAAAETGIPLSSYSSVARGEVFRHPEFAEIGAGYGKNAGQVVLRWILQKGVSVNTMSTKPENIRANFDIMDFTLSSVDMAKIDALTATNLRIVHSDLVPWAPDWD